MVSQPTKEVLSMGLIIVGIILVVVVAAIAAFIYWAIDELKKERYRDYALQLRQRGCKVIYYNETTGTIRYRGKDKRIHSESLYRGYRSHWNGR